MGDNPGRRMAPAPPPPENAGAGHRLGPLEVVLCGLMGGLVLVVFVQVLFRYVIYQPFAWTEEGARFLFIWLCLLGAAAAAKRGAHFAVDLLPRRLPPRPGRALSVVIRLAEAGFYGLITWAGLVVVQVAQLQTAPTLGISMAIPYAAIVAGGLLMALFSLRDAVRALRPDGG